LQWAERCPPQDCLFRLGGVEHPSNTWFPGPTHIYSPNGISIGSAVFAVASQFDDERLLRLRADGDETAVDRIHRHVLAVVTCQQPTDRTDSESTDGSTVKPQLYMKVKQHMQYKS